MDICSGTHFSYAATGYVIIYRSDVTATFRGVVVQNGSDDECKMLVTTLGERNALQEIKKIFSSTFAEHPGVVVSNLL